ncbi:hypothetical protein LB523_12260 [Mesorhizobium sp. ESP-6-4]|uniref:hypothetical protein n=1 Tax=Mesorhizobium sp. ESP-6-4 TaxID=2876624 RepID=UPI001CCA7BC2|nr:hypothetical protein [Mesorhizobium sp. ESP-6-4]MBZ9659820.1 hypothetical protein [Mesorhizobium sp. ESP-6-4]
MIGSRCRIIMGDIDAIVVGKRTYLGDQDKYTVRYLDDGGPQEREFPASMLSFEGREAEGNVVALDAHRRMA